MHRTRTEAARGLIELIRTIPTMERGTLTEEYRTGVSPADGSSVRRGPYYKLQRWEHGRNVSRRVPAAEVPALREALGNYERYTGLVRAFAEQTIAETRALGRASAASVGGGRAEGSIQKRAEEEARA